MTTYSASFYYNQLLKHSQVILIIIGYLTVSLFPSFPSFDANELFAIVKSIILPGKNQFF